MPTRRELESALINADKAGDRNAARALANAIKGMEQTVSQRGTIADSAVKGLTFGFADELSGLVGAAIGTFPLGVILILSGSWAKRNASRTSSFVVSSSGWVVTKFSRKRSFSAVSRR